MSTMPTTDRSFVQRWKDFWFAPGDPTTALKTLAAAIKLDPSVPEAHLYLGAVLLHAGAGRGRVPPADKARGRHELRRFLALAPRSSNASAARQLLRGG